MTRRTDDALQASLEALKVQRPSESEITEGNLAELPIWVLSNKEAKPAGPAGLIRKEDYVRKIIIEEREAGDRREVRALTLAAHPQYGFPTMFAFRVLVALMEEARNHNMVSPVVYITRYELAQRLGIARPSKLQYQDLTNALNALKNLNIEYEHTWWDKSKQTRSPREFSEGFIFSFDFVDERRTNQLALPYPAEGGAGTPQAGRSYVRLGDKIFESLRNRYYVGVDLDYLNAIGRPLAERLYVYLTKRDANPLGLGKPDYGENLKRLAKKLGLAREAPSDIMRNLKPALERLQEEVEVRKRAGSEKVRFLDKWSLSEDKSQLSVWFFRPTPAGRARRQALSPSAG